MKISELLLENTDKKRHKNTTSVLPSAASVDDEPQDEFDDELDSGEDDNEKDENDLPTEGIEEFKKWASQIGSDLWAITPGNPVRKTVEHLKNIGKKLPDQVWSGAFKDEYDEGLTAVAVIMNARNGNCYFFKAGDGASFDGDDYLTADKDQVRILKQVIVDAQNIVKAWDRGSKSKINAAIEDFYRSTLNSNKQPRHAEEWEQRGYYSKADMNRDERDHAEFYASLRSPEHRAAMKDFNDRVLAKQLAWQAERDKAEAEAAAKSKMRAKR